MAKNTISQLSPEERDAYQLIRDLQKSAGKSEAMAIYDFADGWNKRFKGSKSGENIVAVASKAAGVSPSTIYGYLSTCRLYDRATFESLRTQAADNEIVLTFSHFRELAIRLKDRDSEREKIEMEMIKKPMSVRDIANAAKRLVGDAPQEDFGTTAPSEPTRAKPAHKERDSGEAPERLPSGKSARSALVVLQDFLNAETGFYDLMSGLVERGDKRVLKEYYKAVVSAKELVEQLEKSLEELLK